MGGARDETRALSPLPLAAVGRRLPGATTVAAKPLTVALGARKHLVRSRISDGGLETRCGLTVWWRRAETLRSYDDPELCRRCLARRPKPKRFWSGARRRRELEANAQHHSERRSC